VERIFDIGAFTVLLTIDVLAPTEIRGNPYVEKFRFAALALCGLVALMTVTAVMIRKRGHQVAGFLHRVTSRISEKLAHHVDQKVRAFGEGLNTIASGKSLVKLIVVSLVMWFLIALAYRQVAHAYPPEPGATQAEQEEGPPSVDVETAKLADIPELAGQPLTPDVVVSLNSALQQKGFTIKEHHGEFWLTKKSKRIKKVGDRPHLSNMSIPHVLLLMGFSMVGSIVQLPAVGGGSQLAVISALQVVYGIPPELAVSCGILLWLVTFMACIPVGLYFAHREHLSLRKLSKESHAEEVQEEETAPAPPSPAA